MLKLATLAMTLSAACTGACPTAIQDFGATHNGWADILDGGAPVRATLGAVDLSLVGPTGIDGWSASVADLIGDWNTRLTAVGCDAPFRLAAPGEPAHDLVLVPRAEWALTGAIGVEHADTGEALGTIVIKAGADGDYNDDNVPLHELGHAMGNMHASPNYGPSIMTSPAGSQIEDRDVARMACSLGCGPCSPTADPYDLPNAE